MRMLVGYQMKKLRKSKVCIGTKKENNYFGVLSDFL